MTSKIPAGVIPAVKAKCAEVVAAFPTITHVYGYAAWPDHNTRRCIDFMVYNSEKPASQNLSRSEQVKLGDAIAAYLYANRDRLDVNGIIWNHRVMDGDIDDAKYRGPEGVWRAYSGDDPHTDHVHVEFGSSAYVSGTPQRPSVGTVWLDRLVPGVTDSDSIRAVQRALSVPQTGTYDAATMAAVKAYQAKLGDTIRDGLLGPKQTALLFQEAGLSAEIRTDPSGAAVATPPKEPTVTHSLTAVYGNVLWNNDKKRGGGWPARKAGAVRALLSKQPDVIMVCEIDDDQAADIYHLLPGEWGYWRVVGGGRYGPLAIYWRQATMERRADAVEHEYSDDDSRYLLSLPLVHKASGETVWLDVTHLENDGDPATNGKARRKLQTTELAARTTAGKRVGGGDLNSTSLASSTNTDKPRVIMAEAGLHLLTAQPAAKVANRKYASHHTVLTARPVGPWIDDMWWRGVDFVEGGLILTSYSDHHFPWVTVNL